MSSSSALVKFFEGYICGCILLPFKKCHMRKRERYVADMQKLQQRIKQSKNRSSKKILLEQAINVEAKLLVDFSSNKSELMPTRLGNIFKAFENYSQRSYGLDSVVLWPRLIKSIPENYGERLEETNNCVIFLLVSSFVFALMAIESFLITILCKCSDEFVVITIVLGIIFTFMAILFYRISIRAAINYGEVVKSCFDLFRHDLLSSFGIEKPSSLEQERAIWSELRKFILVGEGDPFEKYRKQN